MTFGHLNYMRVMPRVFATAACILVMLGWATASDAQITTAGPPPDCDFTMAEVAHEAPGVAALRVKSLFWTRDYRSVAALRDDADAAVKQARLATARAILELFNEDPDVLRNEDKRCGDFGDAMVQAAAWSLITALRQEIATGEHVDLGADRELLDFARKQACRGANSCKSVVGLVLTAQIAILSEEASPATAPGANAKGTKYPGVRELIREALRQAAQKGPSLDTADAWMVLAEIDGDPADRRLNAEDVRRAYQALRESLQFGAQSNPNNGANSAGLLSRQDTTATKVPVEINAAPPNPFRYRYLPIFQEAVDESWNGHGGKLGVPASDALISALLEIGETARRAQIVNAVSDACDPAQTPFSTAELRNNEVILYPIVGASQTYLLIGRQLTKADQHRGEAAGWTLALAGANSSAVEISEIADRLMNAIQTASAHQWDTWDAGDAQLLYAKLIGPAKLPGRSVVTAPDEAAPILLVFPDPILRNVPWALLHDGPGPQDVHASVTRESAAPVDKSAAFLVRSFAIAVEPGLAYVRPAADPERRGKLLAGGASEANRLPEYVEGFSHTPYLKGHLEPERLTGASFTEAGLTHALGKLDPPVLLLATDAQFAQDGSSITVAGSNALSIGYMPVEHIEDALHQAKLKTRPIELLILVACEGAKGDAGDLGIAGAALRGGALSTLGTLVEVQGAYAPWYVSEDPEKRAHDLTLDPKQPRVTPFLETYYGAARDKKGGEVHAPVQALRVTQLSALDHFDPFVFKTWPQNWGMFVLVGNWR